MAIGRQKEAGAARGDARVKEGSAPNGLTAAEARGDLGEAHEFGDVISSFEQARQLTRLARERRPRVSATYGSAQDAAKPATARDRSSRWRWEVIAHGRCRHPHDCCSAFVSGSTHAAGRPINPLVTPRRSISSNAVPVARPTSPASTYGW